ncbi:MAG: ArsR/SmtB family transcription factor [Burkholderiales bacterium]
MDISETFKTLGDETRLKILSLVSRHELCACLIEEALGLLQPNASKHLRRLKTAGLITCRKVSQWCFYSISSEFKAEYAKLYEFLESEWLRDAQYDKDLEKLETLLKTSDCCEKLLRRKNRPKVAL